MPATVTNQEPWALSTAADNRVRAHRTHRGRTPQPTSATQRRRMTTRRDGVPSAPSDRHANRTDLILARDPNRSRPVELSSPRGERSLPLVTTTENRANDNTWICWTESNAMHLTDPTYYLAASYIRRHSARALRSQIKDAAPTWRCTSRWLDWEETAEDDPARTAAYDAADLFASNAIVMVAGPPYSPGKACELGLAIAHSLPVYAVTVAEEPDLASELCIFMHLVTPIMRASDWLEAQPFHDIEEKTAEAHSRSEMLSRVTSTTPWRGQQRPAEDTR